MHTDELANPFVTRNALITGGAGFIGSHFVDLLVSSGVHVTVLDALTYAGRKENLSSSINQVRFIHGDIRNPGLVMDVIRSGVFDSIINFAAETHVDRSIENPSSFIESNILGVTNLLGAMVTFKQSNLTHRTRLLQISTDEVFGPLGPQGRFTEGAPYSPTSPYSASKAAADHLVRAWSKTYGLDTVIVHGSNNFGPRQHAEKLIPKMILNALSENSLPIYGTGANCRDWVHVRDQCEGIYLALSRGQLGHSYCMGGETELTNLEVVQKICSILDRIRPRSVGSYLELISFVADRPGHDFRYAMDNSKAKAMLGYSTSKSKFDIALEATVRWYLNSATAFQVNH